MAMKILENCIDCGACIEECPNQAISTGDTIHVIDPERCSECAGAFDTPQCQDRCPIDECIVPDPDHQVEARYAQLHAV
jgi:ferredoxin